MKLPSTSENPRSALALPLGFAFMYLAWGGTYLGVKFAITGMPVFLMTGARFFLAGVLLLAGIAVFDPAGFRRGHLREWRDAAAIGLLLLVFGIGTGNWAQQYVDSSFAAMVFSALPLWIVLIEWLRPGGRAPSATVAAGLLLGFAGVGLILAPVGGRHAPVSLGLSALLVGASLSWASGAVFSRQIPKARGSSLLPVARQMMVAGATLLFAGIVHGDATHVHLRAISVGAWLGFAYLVFIGSLGGYPVYLWLLRTALPVKAATVPYANLVVAIFLGWSLGRETITARLLLGTAIILVSVATVLRAKTPARVNAVSVPATE